MPSLRQAAQILEAIASIDPTSRPLKEKLDELVYLLEDAEAEVRSYRDAIEADPGRLAVVEERIDELRTCSASTARMWPRFWPIVKRRSKSWNS